MGVNKAMVAGATGIVGRNLIDHLLRIGGWEVVGVSRRAPDAATGYRHIAADLTDAADCRAKLGALGDITHIFYAGRAPCPNFAEEAAVNREMLVNLIEAVEPAAEGLRHVNLAHGTKWYGCQIGPFKTPSKEDDPRQLQPNFYYGQQDYIEARQKGRPWGWSALRPPLVCGFSVGYPHNLMTAIAVYAAISRELGMPLRFPGNRGCYESAYQAVDAGILAKAMVWAATTSACVNEAFNVTNGDFFRWCNLWPRVAGIFDMEPGGVHEVSLATLMADKAPLWDAIAAKHDLAPHSFEALGNWRFADLIFSLSWDDVSSVVKSRRHGFVEATDTEEMFLRIFEDFRRNRIVP